MATELRWADGSSKGSAVKGSWGTKVTAVVETVLGLPVADKCLIFSQWDDLLSLIAKALGENGVRHGRLHGKQTLDAELHAFKHTAEIRALLLPLRSGANGINLVEAQHVLLAEPLLEAAVEQQAIGRVHRMSQTRETTVHRFVVQDTIEESILGLRSVDDDGECVDGADNGDDALPASPRARRAVTVSRGSPNITPSKGAGSPSKRARKEGKVEEAKLLSWEQLHRLFNDSLG